MSRLGEIVDDQRGLLWVHRSFAKPEDAMRLAVIGDDALCDRVCLRFDFGTILDCEVIVLKAEELQQQDVAVAGDLSMVKGTAFRPEHL